jgi:hypothetical protein
VTDVLIVARASQEVVVGALAGADADVGPTSATGLTAVWCSGDEPVRALGGVDLVAVWDEPEQGHVVLHLRCDGREEDRVWPLEVAGPAAVPPTSRTVVDALRQVLGDPVAPVHDAFADVRSAEGLTTLLEEHFALPVLDPVRRRAVTLHRGRHADARIAGRIAAGAGGVGVTDLGGRWTALHADHPASQQLVTLSAAAAGRRRSLVLQLWRGDGKAAGFDLVLRDRSVAQVGWDDGWRRPADEGWQTRDEIAGVLAHHVGGDVDVPALRALLRARTRATDPLARLVALLGLPPEALDVLDGTTSAPDADRVQHAGWWRVVWEESRAEAAAGLRRTQLWALVVTGVLSTAVLVFALALVATDGALVDHPGATVVDWLLVPVAATGIVGSVVGHRVVRRREAPDVGQDVAPGNPA